MSLKNEYLAGRTVRAQFTIANAAATNASGIIIPCGAIVTGCRINTTGAVVLTNASGTVQIAVGGVNIVATTNIKNLGAQTVPGIIALATTNGNCLTINSEVSIIEGTTNTSTASGTYDVYIDYIYV